MARKLLPFLVIALLLPLAFTQADAQDPPERVIELRISAASRGYVRPLTATGERIGRLEGISDVETLGFAGDTMRFKARTALTAEELAEALQGELVSHGESFVNIAPVKSMRAQRAEARGVIMQISLKILALPKPSWNAPDSDPFFKGAATTTEKMRRLGLSPEILEGHFYKPNDYNIKEDWHGDGGTYRIYVGSEWQEIYVPNDDWWDSPEDEGTDEPDPESSFVGVRIYRSPWSTTFNWADPEGLQMAGTAGRRSDTTADGELYVQQGAEWMEEIMQAIGAYRVRLPKVKMENLPSGRGWGLLAELDDDGTLERWDQQNYSSQSFQLSWEERDGRLIAKLKAHHTAHPFYLEAELDSTTVVEDYKQRAIDQDKSFSDLTRADLGAALSWVVGAETGPEVFQRRRAEAGEIMEQIRTGLQGAIVEHGLDALCGTLDDAELRARLGVKLPEESEFKPADYVIRKQMFGDVEISVGSVRTGGRYWTLVNAAGGEVIRSSQ